jgi:hypothetical protein
LLFFVWFQTITGQRIGQKLVKMAPFTLFIRPKLPSILVLDNDTKYLGTRKYFSARCFGSGFCDEVSKQPLFVRRTLVADNDTHRTGLTLVQALVQTQSKEP